MYGALGTCLLRPTFTYGSSTNTDEFCDFLRALKRNVRPFTRGVKLLLDNHNCHKALKARELMQRLRITPVYLPVASSRFMAQVSTAVVAKLFGNSVA